MNLFYSNYIEHNNIILSEEESKHAVKVMRAVKGDNLFITNGQGKLFKTVIEDISPKKSILKIIEEIKEASQPKYHLHIAIAPTKNHDRLEWFAEKATEIGISEITPVICEHSERRSINHERLERIVIAAMKQSQRLYLPKINPEISFRDFIEMKFDSNKYIASCVDEDKKSLQNIYKAGEDVIVIIGPEGDFSTNELSNAIKNNFIPVSLGSNRYRTETAALLACSTIMFLNEFV
ncbi:MAG TPA: 16S rRNA (uracil(1498)-N(3))-methyltransferase [Bacteroidales bacterium]|nr:16S rRNA (uracil(1498)-N(3))-methyltransferase [Bacteroidales bacterium]HPS17117.1 16S rRNA (uracil(1498)-N(3))-methyltransferase [Bacteroidales bacterium]